MFQTFIAKSLVTLLIAFLLITLLKNLVIKQVDSVKEYFQKNSNSKPEGKSTTRTSLQVRQHADLSIYMLDQLIIIHLF